MCWKAQKTQDLMGCKLDSDLLLNLFFIESSVDSFIKEIWKKKTFHTSSLPYDFLDKQMMLVFLMYVIWHFAINEPDKFEFLW